jgi:hypothetical protein
VSRYTTNQTKATKLAVSRVYDTEGNEIDGSIVGNESEAVAILSFYENRYGKFPQLNRLVITKLVEYKPNEGVKVSVDDDDDIL